MSVALVTHSTKPRGGLVHTLSLAEALRRAGHPVHLVALGDPAAGLHRPTDVPHTVLPAPAKTGTTLDERVFAAIDTLAEGLAGLPDRFDVLHAQDCIAARAAARVRDAGRRVTVVRTVHHIDDFTTAALVDCQRKAISEPDRVLVVSEQWRAILRDEYGVRADVVPNGVDLHRFAPVPEATRRRLRAGIGAQDRFLFLSVGGVEPRKGTVHAFRALARLRRELEPAPVLAVVGGHSFQDYTAYRGAALASLPELGLTLDGVDARSAGAPRGDVVLLGTVDEAELGGWYATADAFAFPSVKEGFGLVVLEAMHAGLPVVASDLPVFEEYLTDGVSALLPRVADEVALAAAMRRLVTDADLRARLRAGGAAVLPSFTWQASAIRHQQIYAQLSRAVPAGTRRDGPVSGTRTRLSTPHASGAPTVARADTLSGMAQPNDIEVRVAALETQVRDLAARVRTSQQDAAAARVLAGGADRDVTEFRGTIRELRGELREFRDQNTRVLNVMREDMNEMREDMSVLREDMNVLREDMADLRTHVDTGFIEMRGKLDATAAGQQQIVALLNTLIAEQGG